MTTPARIGAVHALVGSIGPTQAAFARGWPEADVADLMDGSLYLDRSRGTADGDEIARRIDRLITHSAATGADGILFTGSFFGDAVRLARSNVEVPVLTSFDGLIEKALSLGKPLRVLSTAPDSTTLLVAELEREGAARRQSLSVSGHVVADALDALVAQCYEIHDRLVVDAVISHAAHGVVVLAQFSMERVIEEAQRASSNLVLGPATEGVLHLRTLLQDT